MSKPMCKTSEAKWGYSVTHPVLKVRVTVGPFKDKVSANTRMKEAYGQRKTLTETKTFDYTPSWNGWQTDEYKGDDIVEYYDMPQD